MKVLSGSVQWLNSCAHINHIWHTHSAVYKNQTIIKIQMVSKEKLDIYEKYVFFTEIFFSFFHSGDEIGSAPLG